MNIFYGLDSTLINEAAIKFINSQLDETSYAAPNTYYLDQETINEQIIRIINEASTINIFNQKKVIIINDYYSVLKNNSNLANDFITQLNKFNNNLIIFKLVTTEIDLSIFEKIGKCIFIKPYSKLELKKWIMEKAQQYNLIFNEIAIELMISLYPNNLNIIDNELKKLKNLDQELTLEIIKNNCNKYFNPNIYRLIDALLNQNHCQFWTEYRKYWQKINYDNYNIFNLTVNRLEIMRNIKLLRLNKIDEKEVIKKLEISLIQYKSLLKYKISMEKINELLSLAYNIDFDIKNGKTNKNIAIELFFLKI